MNEKANGISKVADNRQHLIKHCREKMFTNESLKIVALICMLIDHTGATLFRDRRKFCVIDEPRQYENLRLSQE